MQDQTHSLEVRSGRTLLYHHEGKWLHPLLDLEKQLPGLGQDPASLVLEDKIIGKAAALLIVRLGFRKVEAGVLSELGRRVFRSRDIEHSWQQLVDRIDCRTEEILADVEDPDQAHAVILERAARSA